MRESQLESSPRRRSIETNYEFGSNTVRLKAVLGGVHDIKAACTVSLMTAPMLTEGTSGRFPHVLQSAVQSVLCPITNMIPDSRIRLKNPWLAGILAFLLPGAGHLYQGRLFKAGIYSFCILGLFFTGMAMAGWKAVQPPPKRAGGGTSKIKLLKYTAQAAVGLPAMYGLVQRERYQSPDNQPQQTIDEAFSAPFEGYVEYRGENGLEGGYVNGTLYLEPVQGQFGSETVTGRFEGELEGQPARYELGEGVELAKPIQADERRGVYATVLVGEGDRRQQVGELAGHITRPFLNWFQVPMDDHEEQQLHAELGKRHEVAMVFTWVAGLLNILAIWDAVEGPAHGYGDDESGDQAPEGSV